MKKYKYILLSTISFILSGIWFLSTENSLLNYSPRSVMGLSIILLLAGIGLGAQSVNTKETGWIGRIIIIIGVILLFKAIFFLDLGLSPI
jgi:hypothetical protein